MINLNVIVPVDIGVIISITHYLTIPLYFVVAPEQVMKGLEKFSSLSILVTFAFQISEIGPALLGHQSKSLSVRFTTAFS